MIRPASRWLRRRLPFFRDAGRMAAVRGRVRDLIGVRHPALVPVLDLVESGNEGWVLEDWIDAVDLRAILTHCSRTGTALPHNVYLNIATQVCNGLEALHSRPRRALGRGPRAPPRDESRVHRGRERWAGAVGQLWLAALADGRLTKRHRHADRAGRVLVARADPSGTTPDASV